LAPGVRQFFRNQRLPEKGEHELWFSNRLKQAEPLFWIIELAENAAGFIRLDQADDEITFEIALVVAPEVQNRGLGSWAIAQVRSKYPQLTLLADVDPENRASRRAFERAGFAHTSDGQMISRPNSD